MMEFITSLLMFILVSAIGIGCMMITISLLPLLLSFYIGLIALGVLFALISYIFGV